MSQDHIRVIRIYEFTGPRDVVEAQLAKSIQGEKALTNGLVIKAATLGLYPEILTPAATLPVEVPKEPEVAETIPSGVLELYSPKSGQGESKPRYLANQQFPLLAKFEGSWYSTPDPEAAYVFESEDEARKQWNSLIPRPACLRGMKDGPFISRATAFARKSLLVSGYYPPAEKLVGVLETSSRMAGRPNGYLAKDSLGGWIITGDITKAFNLSSVQEADRVWENEIAPKHAIYVRNSALAYISGTALTKRLEEAGGAKDDSVEG